MLGILRTSTLRRGCSRLDVRGAFGLRLGFCHAPFGSTSCCQFDLDRRHQRGCGRLLGRCPVCINRSALAQCRECAIVHRRQFRRKIHDLCPFVVAPTPAWAGVTAPEYYLAPRHTLLSKSGRACWKFAAVGRRCGYFALSDRHSRLLAIRTRDREGLVVTASRPSRSRLRYRRKGGTESADEVRLRAG